jgi:hypothetical protein
LVAEQIITRLAGMGPWNCPCGMTAMGVPTPAAEGGVGDVARSGASPGQLMRYVAARGVEACWPRQLARQLPVRRRRPPPR